MIMDSNRSNDRQPPPGPDPLFKGATLTRYATEPLLGELSNLFEVMMALDWGLNLASRSDPRSLFANEVAGLACLVRAFRGIQAATNLATMGFYTEARAAVRAVYESAGVARMFAHDTALADKWLTKDEWVPDRKSRAFAVALAGGDDEAKIPHQQYYRRASASAHPAAITSISDVISPDGSIVLNLYPTFEPSTFKSLAEELTAEALFVAFCLRNALVDRDVLPPAWHETIIKMTRKFSGEPMLHLEEDWDERQRRFDAIKQHVLPEAEVNEFLRSHPNSYDNVKARADDYDEGSGTA